MTQYSRENPSLRYRELLGYYREMHVHGAVDQNIPPEETFDGRSLPKHASHIQSILSVLGSQTILDYGSGKGNQYKPMKIDLPNGMSFPDIKTFWGVESIACYDPGHEPFATLPTEKFEGVVSTDVLEHCPKEDIPWLVDEIFGFATEFAYINVACYPAAKTLPNGENAHCTLEPPEWWIAIFDERIKHHTGLRYFAAFDVPKPDGNGAQKVVTIMHRGKWNAA